MRLYKAKIVYKNGFFDDFGSSKNDDDRFFRLERFTWDPNNKTS